jgi:hypothetical protein
MTLAFLLTIFTDVGTVTGICTQTKDYYWLAGGAGAELPPKYDFAPTNTAVQPAITARTIYYPSGH